MHQTISNITYNKAIEEIRGFSIYFLDKKGNINSWNKGSELMKGYKKEEVLEKNFSMFFPEDLRKQNLPEKELREAKRNGRYEEENWRMKKDGSLFWAHVVLTPVCNDDQEHSGFIKITQDLTERKTLEDELKNKNKKLEEVRKSVENKLYESEDFSAKILRATLHGIVLLKVIRDDDNQIKDFVFSIFNKAALEIIKREEKDLLGKTLLNEYPGVKVTGIFDKMCQVAGTGKHQEDEISFDHQGFNNWYKISLVKFDHEYVILSFHDISARKEIEFRVNKLNEELEQKVKNRTQELAQVNHDLKNYADKLKKYAHMVSHDLRAPVNAFEGLLEILKEDHLQKPLAGEGEQLLEMMSIKTDEMRQIISNILNSAKGQAKHIEEIDLFNMVHSIVNTFNPPANYNIYIQSNLPTVKYHRISLLQILQNLIGNAIKFMDSPHPVIKIGVTEQKETYQICISDNGPGINEEKLQVLFENYGVVHENKKIESHGYGLFIVKQLVTENGGKAWASSEKGKDTTFYFTIPKKVNQ